MGCEGGTLDAGPEMQHQELEEDADDDDENETGSEDHPYMTAKQQSSVFTVTTLLTLVPKSCSNSTPAPHIFQPCSNTKNNSCSW